MVEVDILIKYKQFRVGDILTWQKKIQIKPMDVPNLSIKGGNLYPFIGQSSSNNAIVGYLRVDPRYLNNIESEPCIIASSNTQEFSYVDTPFFLKEAGGSMSYMKNENLNLYNALYLITALKKELKSRYTYGIKATNERIRESIIKLPVKDDNSTEPDWEYMEVSIKQIKEKYLKQIDKFLFKLGYSSLEDTIISNDDNHIIEKHLNANLKSFKLKELFDQIKRGIRIKSFDRITGNLPFITAGVNKMGFSDYIGNPQAEVFPSNSLTIDMFGNTFYRGYEFGADDHVTILYRTDKKFSKSILQYIQPNIINAIKGKFSYSRNFYASDAPDIEIKLPVTLQGEIDYNLIESYMTVIQKKSVNKLRSHLDKEIDLLNSVNLKY